jgi:hypothetical protein
VQARARGKRAMGLGGGGVANAPGLQMICGASELSEAYSQGFRREEKKAGSLLPALNLLKLPTLMDIRRATVGIVGGANEKRMKA